MDNEFAKQKIFGSASVFLHGRPGVLRDTHNEKTGKTNVWRKNDTNSNATTKFQEKKILHTYAAQLTVSEFTVALTMTNCSNNSSTNWKW